MLPMSSLVWWSLSTTVSSARCSSCIPSMWLSSTSRPTTEYRPCVGGWLLFWWTDHASVWPQWSSNPAWCMWVISRGGGWGVLTPPKVYSFWVLLGTPSGGFPKFFYTPRQDVSGETGERHPLIWSHHRLRDPYVVPSPAACLPTQLGACAGDVAMLAMTVAKPWVADQFRCQRRVFLKLVLRVPLLVSPATYLGSSRLPGISVRWWDVVIHIRGWGDPCWSSCDNDWISDLPAWDKIQKESKGKEKCFFWAAVEVPPICRGGLSPWLSPLKRRGVVLQAFMGGYPFHETYQSGWSRVRPLLWPLLSLTVPPPPRRRSPLRWRVWLPLTSFEPLTPAARELRGWVAGGSARRRLWWGCK